MLRRRIRKNNKCQTMNSAGHLYLKNYEKSKKN